MDTKVASGGRAEQPICGACVGTGKADPYEISCALPCGTCGGSGEAARPVAERIAELERALKAVLDHYGPPASLADGIAYPVGHPLTLARCALDGVPDRTRIDGDDLRDAVAREFHRMNCEDAERQCRLEGQPVPKAWMDPMTTDTMILQRVGLLERADRVVSVVRGFTRVSETSSPWAVTRAAARRLSAPKP